MGWVDLHSHTFFSTCGLYSHLELIKHAEEIGLDGLAITDHGLTLGTRNFITFLHRYEHYNTEEQFKLYKGIECNVIAEDGTIDLEEDFKPFLDVVLVGLHHNNPREKDKSYTSLLVNAIKKNTSVDIIAHPNSNSYPVDYDELSSVAAEYGVLIELNNSSLKYGKASEESMRELIQACKKNECMVVANSDAHTTSELGSVSNVIDCLVEEEFPFSFLLNKDSRDVAKYLDERKRFKK